MKRKSFRYYGISLLLAAALFVFTSQALAINLPYLDKSKIRISVVPGQKKYGTITVENPTPEERSMRLYLEDWRYTGSGDGSKEFLPAGTLPQSCASWISFSPAEITIPAFGRQQISYAVSAPADVAGGYYAVLFFETTLGKLSPTQSGTTGGMSLNIRIASLFYVEAEGTIKRTANLDNLVLEKNKTSSGLDIQADFLNTGNVDITASGTFHIMDDEGVIYARGELNNIYTFPQEKVKLIGSWKEKIPAGKYDLVLTLDLGKALEESGMNKGQSLIKEAKIDLAANGEVLSVGKLK